MGDPVTIGLVSLALGAVGTGASIMHGQSAAAQQKKAARQASSDAARQASLQEQAMNKANKKAPNIPAMAMANAVKSSTSLSGSSGVAPGSLSLGRTTLLGG